MKDAKMPSTDQAPVPGYASIREAREAKHLTYRQLAALVGCSVGHVFSIETGVVQRAKPDTLAAIATALDISSAELLTAAGYDIHTALPSFSPYLRTKYRTLPAAAHAELEQSFKAIADKYGYDPNGPAPGEDEI